MDSNQKISVILKEYDYLRKEMDLRTDATKTYGWPVIIVAVGTIASWKNLDYGFVILLVPVIFVTILSLVTNANYDICKFRISLKSIEAKINNLADSQLLNYETSDNWSKYDLTYIKWVKYYVIPVYLFLELLLYKLLDINVAIQLHIGVTENSSKLYGFIAVVIFLICAPVLYYLSNALRWEKLLKSQGIT